MATHWVLLGTATANGSATTLSLDFVAKPTKSFLKFTIQIKDGNNGSSNEMCYNTDSRTGNTKYSWVDWNMGSTSHSEGTGQSFHRLSGDVNDDLSIVGHIININGKEKQCMTRSTKVTSSDSSTVSVAHGFGTWNDTAQITKMTWSAEGQTLVSGSKLIVWGADDAALTPVYPNLTNGTLFEESDTGKIYMFDGTDTWNEMT